MYQHGNIDIRVLKEILGHVSLSTTEIYTHVSNKQMENAARKSPLSNVSPSKKPRVSQRFSIKKTKVIHRTIIKEGIDQRNQQA
jgi:hypothetical protein